MKALTDMGEYQLLQKGAFFLVDPGKQKLRMLVQYNANNLLETCQVVHKGQCLCGKVLAHNHPIYKSCVDDDHSTHPPGMKPHGHYVIPVKWENEILGVFTLYIEENAPYSDKTYLFLEMVAESIAKRLILDRLQEMLNEMQGSYRAAAGLMKTILPKSYVLETFFNGESAIYHRSLHDIGGDFYFFFEKESYIYFGVGDAEGHGIAGALLAAVLIHGLHEIIEKWPYARPAEILLSLHESLIRTYQGSESIYRSGADLALCLYNRQTGELRYAGANVPILCFSGKKMGILEPVPAAVGTSQLDAMHILDVRVDLQPNMRLCLMTDGFASQFGGESRATPQKFGRRRLYELLERTSELSIQDQMTQIQAVLAEWQGSHEQTDDITLWLLKPEALRS